jgi:putative dehydrogenase
MTPRVGVVGLGAMGGAMSATLLARGFTVTGFDTDAARSDRLVSLGGTAASSPAEVAEGVDVLILSLPTEAAFEAVCVDPAGIAGGAHAGLVVVETSTLPIALKERGRVVLADRGAVLLDCPLSGTGDQAVHGDLVVFASGDAAAAERCAPVFEGFGRAHYYLGEFGAGSRMKLVANLLVAVHNVAAAEALQLALRAGLDPDQTLEVIGDSAGTSRMFEVRGPKMVRGEYAPGVRTSIFQKDLGLIGELVEEHGVSAPLFGLSTRLYEAAAAAGHAEDDTSSVYEVLSEGWSDERR